MRRRRRTFGDLFYTQTSYMYTYIRIRIIKVHVKSGYRSFKPATILVMIMIVTTSASSTTTTTTTTTIRDAGTNVVHLVLAILAVLAILVVLVLVRTIHTRTHIHLLLSCVQRMHLLLHLLLLLLHLLLLLRLLVESCLLLHRRASVRVAA